MKTLHETRRWQSMGIFDISEIRKPVVASKPLACGWVEKPLTGRGFEASLVSNLRRS